MTANKITKFFWIFSALAAFIAMIGVENSAALCIKKNKANLRQGPGTKYEKKWQVFKYMPFEKLKTKGSWYRVRDLDGDIFWVHKKLTTRDYKCAVIKENKTNLRKGPGTKHPMVDWSPVDKYFSMKVLEIKNNWVRVEDGVGDRAWIYRPLVWIQ